MDKMDITQISDILSKMGENKIINGIIVILSILGPITKGVYYLKNYFSKDILIKSGKNNEDIRLRKIVLATYIDVVLFFGAYFFYIIVLFIAHCTICFIKAIKGEVQVALGYNLGTIVIYFFIFGYIVVTFILLRKGIKTTSVSPLYSLLKVVYVEITVCSLLGDVLYDGKKILVLVSAIYMASIVIFYQDGKETDILIYHQNKILKGLSIIRYLLIGLELGFYSIYMKSWNFSLLFNIWVLVSIIFLINKMCKIDVGQMGVMKFVNLKPGSDSSNVYFITRDAIRINEAGLIYIHTADNKWRYFKSIDINSITYTFIPTLHSFCQKKEWKCKLNGGLYTFDYIKFKKNGWVEIRKYYSYKEEVIFAPIENVECLTELSSFDYEKFKSKFRWLQ